MFCPKCGVKIQDDTKKCPLCLTSLPQMGEGVPLYPDGKKKHEKEDFRVLLFLVTLFLLMAGGICLSLDLVETGRVTFSAFVLFGIALFYSVFFLPRWFRRPNPVIFLPVVFLFVMGTLLYADLRYEGGWFLSFAFPVVGGFFLCLEAAVSLIRYLKKGKMYVFSGLFFAMGILSFVGEILYRVTFFMPIRLTYSIPVLIFFSFLGIALLVIAIVPCFRRYMERRFFV